MRLTAPVENRGQFRTVLTPPFRIVHMAPPYEHYGRDGRVIFSPYHPSVITDCSGEFGED